MPTAWGRRGIGPDSTALMKVVPKPIVMRFTRTSWLPRCAPCPLAPGSGRLVLTCTRGMHDLIAQVVLSSAAQRPDAIWHVLCRPRDMHKLSARAMSNSGPSAGAGPPATAFNSTARCACTARSSNSASTSDDVWCRNSSANFTANGFSRSSHLVVECNRCPAFRLIELWPLEGDAIG